MVNAAWLFGKEDHSDAQLELVEERDAHATDGELAKMAPKNSTD
jgi:hypothetical protein